MSGPSTCSVRLICGRIIIRMSHQHGSTLTELSLDEALAVRAMLNRGIAGLQSGLSFTDDLDMLIAGLNR